MEFNKLNLIRAYITKDKQFYLKLLRNKLFGVNFFIVFVEKNISNCKLIGHLT